MEKDWGRSRGDRAAIAGMELMSPAGLLGGQGAEGGQGGQGQGHGHVPHRLVPDLHEVAHGVQVV